MKVWLALAGLLTGAVLVAGCQTDVSGNPVVSPEPPTEPSFPTSRPTRPTAAPPRTLDPTPTNTPRPPTGAEVLAPENGYVFIETKSGKTRCQINEDEVGCESAFTDSPVIDGMHATGVRLSASGEIRWLVGNLGDIPVVTLDYRTYQAVGWSIDAGESGTRFTNDRTGRGMVVAVEGVQAF